MRTAHGILVAAAGLTALGLALPTPAQSGDPDEAHFRVQVAPVLETRCLQCHDAKRPRGGLDLTSRAAVLRGGDAGPAVVPGDPEKSLLYKMIHGPRPRMPQRGDRLAETQVEAVRRWIERGAAWPQGVELTPSRAAVAEAWWSLRPLRRPALPKVNNAAWPRTPIDAFILAKLEEMGLTPAAEVDRLTFLRRAKFDLHGLPPTPEEIDAFVNDRSPQAFERLIDRLLASPHYGERWGRHWLDVVHYADTHGYDKDKRRLWAWLFRDWVIRAFNDDMPYDRFVRMQLAGDTLAPGDPDGVTATGFVVAGPWDFVGHVELREGTVEKMKTRALDRDDMVANALSTFLSVTVHCARCHDHKFDPISQKEYYQLQAVFAGVERGDRPLPTAADREQLTRLQRQKQQLEKRQAAIEGQIRAAASPELAGLDAELTRTGNQLAASPRPVAAKGSPSNGWHSAIEKTPGVTKWVQLDLGRSLPIDAIRLVPARPTDFPDTPGFGFPARFRVAVSDDPTFATADVLVDQTAQDYPNPGDNEYVLRLPSRSARHVRVTANRLWERRKDYCFALAEIRVDSGGQNVAAGAAVTALDSVEAGRWSRKHLVDGHDSRNRLPGSVDKSRDDRLHRWQELIRRRQRIAADLVSPQAVAEVVELRSLLAGVNEHITAVQASRKVYAVVPVPPRPIHVLHRGNVEDPRELVGPAALSLLPGLGPGLRVTDPAVEGQRRLALADWLVHRDNALAWRSIVNRVWQYHFGRGLVDTPNDFGKNGSPPTHPELLDWLASEFRDNGMSFKKLHRTILLSAAYRQSSAHDPHDARIDADNRYLWRMHRQRLDAESLRDAVLTVSGRLNPAAGGPGYELFRFKDDHSPTYDHASVAHATDPQTFRRTVYRFVVRSVPNPFLETLDCADPNVSVPKRNTTLTALQALALLNNPFMVRQAESFADRLRRECDDPAGQIDAAYRLCFGRRPDAEERAAVLAYTRRHGLANTCRLLFNANEFLFVD